jgi:hypothetical protein
VDGAISTLSPTGASALRQLATYAVQQNLIDEPHSFCHAASDFSVATGAASDDALERAAAVADGQAVSLGYLRWSLWRQRDADGTMTAADQ